MAYFEECGFDADRTGWTHPVVPFHVNTVLYLDAVCMNEHHAKPYGLMPSPNLMAAALIRSRAR